MAEALKYEIDKTGKLEKLFEEIREQYFSGELEGVRINYVFRTTQRRDDDGYPILGEASKLPNRERDLYGFDFEICVFRDTWVLAPRKEQKRIAWHELNHLVVVGQEDGGDPEYDKADRVKIGIRPHDLIIKTFKEEIEIFGPTKSELYIIKKIAEITTPKVRKLKRRK